MADNSNTQAPISAPFPQPPSFGTVQMPFTQEAVLSPPTPMAASSPMPLQQSVPISTQPPVDLAPQAVKQEAFYVLPKDFDPARMVYGKPNNKKWEKIEKDQAGNPMKKGGSYFDVDRMYRYTDSTGREVIMPLMIRYAGKGIWSKSTMGKAGEFNALVWTSGGDTETQELRAALERMYAADRASIIGMGLKTQDNLNFKVKVKHPKNKTTDLPDTSKAPYIVFKYIDSRYEKTVIRVGNSDKKVDVNTLDTIETDAVWFFKFPSIYVGDATSPRSNIADCHITGVAKAKEEFVPDDESELKEDQIDDIFSQINAISSQVKSKGPSEPSKGAQTLSAQNAINQAVSQASGFAAQGQVPMGAQMPPGFSVPSMPQQQIPAMPPGFAPQIPGGAAPQAQWQGAPNMMQQLAQGGQWQQPGQPQAPPQWNPQAQYQQGGQPGANQYMGAPTSQRF